MHFAPLSLFIISELLLIWAGSITPIPAWLHAAAIICLGALFLALSALLQKRERRVRDGLRREILGMQQDAARAARRYKSLLEGAGNPIFVFNAENGLLEEVNRIGMELLGFSKDELSSMLGRDLLHATEHEKFRSFVFQLKRHGRAHSDGLQFQKKDGSLFLGEIDARLIDLGDDQVVHCILRDITHKWRIEKEISQRNRELSILNDILTGVNRGPELKEVKEGALADIMELFQAGGASLHIIRAGSSTAEFRVSLGVSQQLDDELCDFILRQPRRFSEVYVQEVAPEEGLSPFSHAAADGWGSLTVIPLIVQDHLIGVIHLMHSSPYCYSPEELRFLASAGKQMGNVIETARLINELHWKSAELLRSHRLLEKTSHNLSVSEIKLKQNLALVEQAHVELSRLDRMKVQFLGMVSHEFNTPLTSIISGADHLLQQDAGMSEDVLQVLEMVRDGGLRLKELVADLLRLVRLEAQGSELETSAVQLERFMIALTDRLKSQLKKRKQTVKLIGLDTLPFFDADRSHLERVFGELLMNAIRFSPPGGEIEVIGRVTERNALWARKETLDRFNSEFLRRCGDRCYMEVEVKDNGIGIPVEDQQGIFEMFYSVGEIRHHSSNKSGQGKGPGLGLAIVKGMVEAHGGMIWVESTGGSSFFVLLPLEQEASQPALF